MLLLNNSDMLGSSYKVTALSDSIAGPALCVEASLVLFHTYLLPVRHSASPQKPELTGNRTP